MRQVDFEVVIAGGGPAGSACAAAILNERPDLAGRVLVLERARHPRPKPCGGGLTGHVPGALAALGLRLDAPAYDAAEAQVAFGGLRRRVALGRPVQVVRREEFDEGLLRQAEARGAEVWQGAALTDLALEGDAVRVEVAGRPALRARVLVGADGAGSLVRKRVQGHRAGAGPRPLRLFRAEVSAPSPGEMIYDFSPMSEGVRGYLWLFPVPGGRLNVGIMHYPVRGASGPSGAELAAICTRHLLRHGVHVPPGALRGWPAWGYDPRAPLSAPRLCLCGDAAGIDALTGEGIAVALEQGRLAGAATCAALRSGDFRFADYDALLRRAAVGRELALDRTLARLLYDHGPDDPGWQRWLGMVLFDEALLRLYAARVAGTLVLADHRFRLLPVLLRSLLRTPSHRRRLQAAA